jgi:hypothetical protein
MVSDGRTPWCLGVEAGPESGAAAADWVESLVLGGSGPAVYEDWAVGGLGQETGSSVLFSDFRVRSAVERFGEIALGDGFVLGGPGSIGLIPARLAAWPEVSGPQSRDLDPPSCWLTHGRGTDRQGWPAELSAEVEWFALPAADAAHAGAAGGTVYSVVVFHDRPEVRRVVEHLLGTAFAARLAGAPAATGLLPVRAVDPSAFRDSIDGAQSSLLGTALRTGAFRSDASGLMSPQVASAFSAGMLTYLAEGDASLDDVLDDLAAGGSGIAPAGEENALRAAVTYDGTTCTYRGPAVVPLGSSLEIDFSVTRAGGSGTLVVAPAWAYFSWADVIQAEASPAGSAPYGSALGAAWPSLSLYTGPLTGPGFLQETSAPGKHTFVLDAPSLAYRYLVVCTAADARHPTAATLIRLVEP